MNSFLKVESFFFIDAKLNSCAKMENKMNFKSVFLISKVFSFTYVSIISMHFEESDPNLRYLKKIMISMPWLMDS